MANVGKTLAKIRVTVESGAYYEAQQLYKSVYYRHKARKQMEESFQILQEGAVTQLGHGQVTCGVELGLLLIEAYTAEGTPADDAAVGRIMCILDGLPAVPGAASGSGAGSSGAGAGPSTQQQRDDEAVTASIDECSRLVAAAVKWAHKAGASDVARQINSVFARYLYVTYGSSRIGRALLHFIRGSDAGMFAEALHCCALQGPQDEADLWLLRAVLQVTVLGSGRSREAQLQYAREVFVAFTAQSHDLDTPTVHCADLLLLALEHSSHELFTITRDKYAVVLRRDSSFGPLLTRIEQAYYNIAPQGGGLEGLLGGLLKSLGVGEMGDFEMD